MMLEPAFDDVVTAATMCWTPTNIAATIVSRSCNPPAVVLQPLKQEEYVLRPGEKKGEAAPVLRHADEVDDGDPMQWGWTTALAFCCAGTNRRRSGGVMTRRQHFASTMATTARGREALLLHEGARFTTNGRRGRERACC